MIYHCFFEQSGTFKNEFKKLGFEAYDYDILNNYGETDYVIDLYKEIENAYENKKSVFDRIGGGTILAFFPCIRFEHQIRMHFKGVARHLKGKSMEEKLKYDIELHNELHNLYVLISKMVIVCIRKNIPLIIENPYTTTHYLTQYWCIPYTILDENRTKRGDYYEKPTQYWFINREPSNNFIFEPIKYVETKRVNKLGWVNSKIKEERSMIHPQYANRFIREFII